MGDIWALDRSVNSRRFKVTGAEVIETKLVIRMAPSARQPQHARIAIQVVWERTKHAGLVVPTASKPALTGSYVAYRHGDPCFYWDNLGKTATYEMIRH
jgi:hypothetical protein